MLQQIIDSLAGLTDLEKNDLLAVLLTPAVCRREKVKLLLGINGADQDSILEFVIQTLEEMILAYIGQDTLPAPLEKVLVVMAVSYYKAAALGNSSAAVGSVSSVRRGDVTTSFTTTSGASGSAPTFNLGQGDDFLGWKTVLNQYRKLRW